MKTYVLIPGAWSGGWIWQPVVAGLRGQGHAVYPMTLSGLGGRDADVSGIGLNTHVEDVLSVLLDNALRDVVLVAHGTSGVIAGIVADRAPELVAHTVYVEGFLPHHGRSVLQAFGSLYPDELRTIAENHGRWPAPDATVIGDGQGLTAEQAEWLASRMTDHPGRSLTEPVRLTSPLESRPAVYVVCSMEHFGGRLADDVEGMRSVPGWTFGYLATGLWPMLSAPEELVRLLDEVPVKHALLRSTPLPSRAAPLGNG
ncbi:alpha/beta hydrolase [Actinoallomurus vinaceus]|uniref:Alpha/beta hydrolase n=1 Tax=Actinoallomurus vinaceus TaxID=1080074 RepID=A0ABP8U445_9ACTN